MKASEGWTGGQTRGVSSFAPRSERWNTRSVVSLVHVCLCCLLIRILDMFLVTPKCRLKATVHKPLKGKITQLYRFLKFVCSHSTNQVSLFLIALS